MTVDLYSYYKKYYQRWHRNQQDDNLFQMKEISYQIAFIVHKNIQKVDYLHINRAIELAEELFQIENEYGNYTKFSLDIIDALKNRNVKVDIPHPVAHRWNFSPEFSAYIYVATSQFREGECKLGVTTLNPELRAKKYASKYGYSINIYDYVEAMNPYEVEAKIASDLSSMRVSKNAEGDSIEWYRMHPNEMFAILRDAVN